MKKNKLMRVACALLVITLLSTCVISGTFAKYVSQTHGDDIVTVAKWSVIYTENDAEQGTQIAVSSKDKNGAPTIGFDLFNTILDSDKGVENDVAEGKIAPGTRGALKFEIKNESEVTAKMNLQVAETNNSSIPLTFKMNGVSGSSISDVLNGQQEADMVIAMGASKTYTIEWEWPFYVSASKDVTDTDLGVLAHKGTAPSYEVTATLTVTQVD